MERRLMFLYYMSKSGRLESHICSMLSGERIIYKNSCYQHLVLPNVKQRKLWWSVIRVTFNNINNKNWTEWLILTVLCNRVAVEKRIAPPLPSNVNITQNKSERMLRMAMCNVRLNIVLWWPGYSTLANIVIAYF